MEFKDFEVDKGDGTKMIVQVALPERLDEVSKVFPEVRALKIIRDEMIKKAVRRAISSRKRHLKLIVNDLTLEQQAVLRKIGLLKVF